MASAAKAPPSAGREPLEALLSAPSKAVVDEFLCSCAAEREQPEAVSAARIAEISAAFGLGAAEASKLQRAGAALVGDAVYHRCGTAEQATTLFPDSFHADLRGLLARQLAKRVEEWRATSLLRGGVSSMPRLQRASTQVYRKPAAEAGGLPTPAMRLNLQLDGGPNGPLSAGREVSIEMSREQLETLLGSLGKVKEQLDKVSR